MKYFARRIVHTALLLLAISFLCFALVQISPSDYFDAMRLNPRISSQTIDHIRTAYGMDRPLVVRYGRWLHSTFHGEMGFSLAYNVPVWPLLRVRAQNTLLLTGTSTLLAWLIAIPLGIWSAEKRGTHGDRLVGLATSAILAVPDLLVYLALLLLAVRTGWFPTGGMESLGSAGMSTWGRMGDTVRHLVLPAMGLAVVALPVLLRHVRSAMVDALESPFVCAARGHGIPRRRLIYRYALPAAVNPLVTLVGLSVAAMLSTSLLAEVILSWPGMGPLLLEAIFSRDVYIVTGAVMLSSMFLMAGNLLADFLIFVNDPRIRVE
jgi:peptide/nickel transport system permease protein